MSTAAMDPVTISSTQMTVSRNVYSQPKATPEEAATAIAAAIVPDTIQIHPPLTAFSPRATPPLVHPKTLQTTTNQVPKLLVPATILMRSLSRPSPKAQQRSLRISKEPRPSLFTSNAILPSYIRSSSKTLKPSPSTLLKPRSQLLPAPHLHLLPKRTTPTVNKYMLGHKCKSATCKLLLTGYWKQ